jgi:hypothetical protein
MVTGMGFADYPFHPINVSCVSNLNEDSFRVSLFKSYACAVACIHDKVKNIVMFEDTDK